jgi:hypothetical protein
MNRFEKAGPRQMRKTGFARAIAVCFVGGQRSQRLIVLSALDADYRQAKRRQAMKDRRGHAVAQAPGFRGLGTPPSPKWF